MSKEREALQKIVARDAPPYNPATLIAMEALKEQTRYYSEEEVMRFGNFCRIHENKHPNEVWTIQQLYGKYLQSLSQEDKPSKWDKLNKEFDEALENSAEWFEKKKEEDKPSEEVKKPLTSGFTVEPPHTYAIKMAENDKVCFAPCPQYKIDAGQCSCHNNIKANELKSEYSYLSTTSPNVEEKAEKEVADGTDYWEGHEKGHQSALETIEKWAKVEQLIYNEKTRSGDKLFSFTELLTFIQSLK